MNQQPRSFNAYDRLGVALSTDGADDTPARDVGLNAMDR
jgi:hypothetical protein